MDGPSGVVSQRGEDRFTKGIMTTRWLWAVEVVVNSGDVFECVLGPDDTEVGEFDLLNHPQKRRVGNIRSRSFLSVVVL